LEVHRIHQMVEEDLRLEEQELLQMMPQGD
jgi:hypothetical protein